MNTPEDLVRLVEAVELTAAVMDLLAGAPSLPRGLVEPHLEGERIVRITSMVAGVDALDIRTSYAPVSPWLHLQLVHPRSALILHTLRFRVVDDWSWAVSRYGEGAARSMGFRP